MVLDNTGQKSVLFGLSVSVTVAIIFVIVRAMQGATIGAGVIGALIALVGFIILSVIVTGVFTLLTKRKEALLSGFFATLAILLLGALVAMIWNTTIATRLGIAL